MHIVLEETLAAAGQGNVLASRLIHRAHAEPGWSLYAPACALVEADRARPGTAEHLAALPGITILELDLPAVLAVARQETWAAAHSRARGAAGDRPPRRCGGGHYRSEAVGRPAGPGPGPHAVTRALAVHRPPTRVWSVAADEKAYV